MAAKLMKLLFCLGTAGATHLYYTIEDYKSLTESLLSNYSSKIRPIKNQGASLQMQTSMWLIGINDVNAVDQKLVTTAYLYATWKDELINWNSTSTGIYWMQFNQKDLWMPDLVLKNGFTEFKPLGGNFYYVFVDYDGTVHWYPYMVFESSCDIDISHYPFDKQSCKVSFKTWSYSRWEINLTVSADKVGFYEFVENSVWEVTSTDATYDVSAYETDVHFIINLRRKPLYYVMNLILPIIFLGVLNLLVFIIPADAGEKMGYAVTIFLTFAVFLTMVSGELPINSDNVSILSVYLIVQLCIGIFVLIITSLQLRLHHRTAERNIGKVFCFLVRMERRLRCEGGKNSSESGCFLKKCKCCMDNKVMEVDERYLKSRQGKEKEAMEEMEEQPEMSWNDVSSAIDFFAFWILLIFEFIVSTVVFTYASAY
ncbi:neuronal acetylcholine receptor subunit alpha-7-like [Saccostrea echinata]|uniref:neuronal acetylcholine receptor subunit alpha-7-like n=1 Tax=Saccostrea echinata TaxID=191078 RepID=UPI002A7F2E83|nr:neuronal acetylcholine receptor subunit alpha-7-like [Saccostrea echinata]